MFGLVEEFILPFAVDHAQAQLLGDDYQVRALLQFAGEEAKHIHLFKTFAGISKQASASSATSLDRQKT